MSVQEVKSNEPCPVGLALQLTWPEGTGAPLPLLVSVTVHCDAEPGMSGFGVQATVWLPTAPGVGVLVGAFVFVGVFVGPGVLVMVGVLVIVGVGVGVQVGSCPVPHDGARGTMSDVAVAVRVGFEFTAAPTSGPVAAVGVRVGVAPEVPVPFACAQSSRLGVVLPVPPVVCGVRVAVPTGVRVGVPLAWLELTAAPV